MKKLLLVLSLTLVAAACSKKEDAKPEAPPVPQKPAHEVVQMPALTSDQKLMLKEFTRKTSLIPDGNLFLVNPNETQEQRTARELKIAALSPDARGVYNDVTQTQKCQLSNPVEIQSGDQPDHVGATAIFNSSSAVSGIDCAVSYSDSGKHAVHIDSMSTDQNANLTQITNSITIAEESTLAVRSQVLSQVSGMSSRKTTTNGSATQSINTTDNSSLMSQALTSVVEIVTTDMGVVKADVKNESSNQVSAAGIKTTTYFEVRLHLAMGEVVAQHFMDMGVSQYFLNGETVDQATYEMYIGSSNYEGTN